MIGKEEKEQGGRGWQCKTLGNDQQEVTLTTTTCLFVVEFSNGKFNVCGRSDPSAQTHTYTRWPLPPAPGGQ
jgi:hypothetical protein